MNNRTVCASIGRNDAIGVVLIKITPDYLMGIWRFLHQRLRG
ncbi:hypothetical protein [Methylotenera oryzisoli]|nr:hypothetical protein [Methylotenera oryzisoli]